MDSRRQGMVWIERVNTDETRPKRLWILLFHGVNTRGTYTAENEIREGYAIGTSEPSKIANGQAPPGINSALRTVNPW